MADPTPDVEITLMGKLPDSDLNGLIEHASAIFRNQDKEYVIIGRLVVRDEVFHRDGGDYTLKMGVQQIEVMGGSDEREVLATLATKLTQRTGLTQIPGFAPQGVNQRTGEIEDDAA